jgi:catalase
VSDTAFSGAAVAPKVCVDVAGCALPGRRRVRALKASMLMPIAIGIATVDVRSAELENIPAGEQQAIKTIVSLALGELQKRYPPGAPLVRRDAHAKAHGCVKAVFRVDSDISADLRVGLAARPGYERKAWVRFSNGAFEPGADTGMDGRGMALKIMEEDPGGKSTSLVASHDLLMINYPVFFSPDASDYTEFATAGALTGNSDGLKRYFLPSYNPRRWRIRQALIAYRIASQSITSPLSTQYFSMVPFSFGSERAVKYSAKPCASSTNDAATDRTAPDFLSASLRSELARGSACFELLVQEKRGDMPVEDATVEWSQTKSPYRRVGTIAIPQQRVEGAERAAFCENAIFNPWNAPPENQPLGGMNRLRKAVYEAISRYRHDQNNVSGPNPAAAWDAF